MRRMNERDETPGDEQRFGAVARYLDSEIQASAGDSRGRTARLVAAAALSGVPWVGGVISTAQTLQDGRASARADQLLRIWLTHHERKLARLTQAIDEILGRLDSIAQESLQRIASPEYLALVTEGFRVWDESSTDEKRKLIQNLIENAGGTRVVADDIVRLFVQWIRVYHEAHFAVIREIQQDPGVTRYEIWTRIYDREVPREDSSDADLYRLLIRDLSTGGVIRQARDTTADGQFMRRTPQRRNPTRTTLDSSFEDTKPYVLTELGVQFVHYTMNELVPRIDGRDP